MNATYRLEAHEQDRPEMSNGRMTGHSAAPSTGNMVKLTLFTGVEFCDGSPLGVWKRYNRARSALSNAFLQRRRCLRECFNGSTIGNLITFCISTAMCVCRPHDDQHAD